MLDALVAEARLRWGLDLAAGLQVVATNIPEVAVLGLCRVADTPEEFLRQVEEALRTPGPRPEISEAVRNEGWDARLAEIERHLARVLSERSPQ